MPAINLIIQKLKYFFASLNIYDLDKHLIETRDPNYEKPDVVSLFNYEKSFVSCPKPIRVSYI